MYIEQQRKYMAGKCPLTAKHLSVIIIYTAESEYTYYIIVRQCRRRANALLLGIQRWRMRCFKSRRGPRRRVNMQIDVIIHNNMCVYFKFLNSKPIANSPSKINNNYYIIIYYIYKQNV